MGRQRKVGWRSSRLLSQSDGDLNIPTARKKVKRLQDIEKAFRLELQGDLSRGEIAKALECSPAKLTGLLKTGYQNHGKPFLDRRGRQVPKNQSFKYMEIADSDVELVSGGMSFTEVGAELKSDRATISKANSYWHDSQGRSTPPAGKRSISSVK